LRNAGADNAIYPPVYMRKLTVLKIGLSSTALLLLSLSGWFYPASTSAQTTGNTATETVQITADADLPLKTDETRLLELQRKITYGNATLLEVKQALSNTSDVAGLTNTLHAMYSMRWHRGVINLLDDMWADNHTRVTELAWDALAKVPARIALASTINRIRSMNQPEYLEYIRAHRYDEHEFHRAQVVISLGLNGDPVDVAYLQEMAEGDNVYVAQSAITALGMLVHPKSKEALSTLSQKYINDDRGRLIREVFQKAYPVVR
jgi:hypothetical protein